MTRYLRPASLEEALAARSDHPDYLILAGGTDLLVAAHKNAAPKGIIDLFGLAALGRIERTQSHIRVGAGVTYAQILASELIARELPILCRAAREIGALQIQARGTLGGNIGTSSPVGDTLPVLLALDAELELAGPDHTRVLPYHEFCTGYRSTALGPAELITAVRFPRPADGLRQVWRKVGTRRAQSISKVMMAAAARLEAGVIDHPRVALGAVAAQPIRARAVEEAMSGAAPGPELAERVRAVLAAEIHPIDDVRSTARYRLRVAQNLVARFVLSLAAEP